jgi:hypothetical protein
MMELLLAKMDANQAEMLARMMAKMDSQLEKMEGLSRKDKGYGFGGKCRGNKN